MPKCDDCGKQTDRCVMRHPNGVVTLSKFRCGDCEYKREHPDALQFVPPPRERRAKPLQKEALF